MYHFTYKNTYYTRCQTPHDDDDKIGAAHVTITDRSDSNNNIALTNVIQSVLLNKLDSHDNSTSEQHTSSPEGVDGVFKGNRCSVMPLDWGVMTKRFANIIAPAGDIS
jgi:hypothetical protein